MNKVARRKQKVARGKPARQVGDGPDIAARIAWGYLAAVLAAVIGGLLALVLYQVVRPVACAAPVGDAAELAVTCELLWASALAMTGFLAAYAAALALLKVERWPVAWMAVAAGFLGLLGLIVHALDWWWWVGLLLLPALAALVSAPWRPDPVFRRVQVLLVGLALVAGIAGVAVGLALL